MDGILMESEEEQRTLIGFLGGGINGTLDGV